MIQFKFLPPNTISVETQDYSLFKEFLDSFVYSSYRPDRFGKMRATFHSPISLTGKFNAGLFVEVIKKAREMFGSGIGVDPAISKILFPFYSQSIKIKPLPNSKFKYFDDQKDAIEKFLKFGRGIIVSPCASGKSAIIAGILESVFQLKYLKSSLIIVPTRQLVTQLYKDFIDYGVTNVQEFSSGTGKRITEQIVISNRQWLQLHAKELPKTDILIVDECDTLGNANNKLNRYISSIKTPIRLGLTATMPKLKEHYYEVVGQLGTVLHLKKYQDLKESRQSVDVEISSLKFKFNLKSPKIAQIYDDENLKPSERYAAEISHFLNSPSMLITVVEKIRALSGNTLVLFDYLETRDKLKKYFDDSILKLDNRKILWIDGGVAVEVREDIRSELETSNNMVLFAQSQTLGRGINIKNLNNVVLLFTTKSSSKIVQSIGRGMRNLLGKFCVKIIDVSSNLRYAARHYSHRKKLYSEYFGVNSIHDA